MEHEIDTDDETVENQSILRHVELDLWAVEAMFKALKQWANVVESGNEGVEVGRAFTTTVEQFAVRGSALVHTIYEDILQHEMTGRTRQEGAGDSDEPDEPSGEKAATLDALQQRFTKWCVDSFQFHAASNLMGALMYARRGDAPEMERCISFLEAMAPQQVAGMAVVMPAEPPRVPDAEVTA